MELKPYNLYENYRTDVNIVGIYIAGYEIDDFYKWVESSPEHNLTQYLDKYYKHYLKSIYFDNQTMRNEHMPPHVRSNIMECILNWTYDLYQPQTVKCFTMCNFCNRVCTIGFHYTCIPVCSRVDKHCTECHRKLHNDVLYN